MKINLIAVGARMPAWVNQGFETYAERLPAEFELKLIEVASHKRLKNTDLSQLLEQESQKLLAASPTDAHLIALDRNGREFNTLELAEQLLIWRDNNQNISLLIGGPEGLSDSCLKQAKTVWSLSKLTLPHPLVRVLIAEQISRAWSIMARHPYHS